MEVAKKAVPGGRVLFAGIPSMKCEMSRDKNGNTGADPSVLCEKAGGDHSDPAKLRRILAQIRNIGCRHLNILQKQNVITKGPCGLEHLKSQRYALPLVGVTFGTTPNRMVAPPLLLEGPYQ